MIEVAPRREGPLPDDPAHERSPASRPRLQLAVILLVAALFRLGFVAAMQVPTTSDPWRHMLLINNIRRGAGFTLFAGQPYIWYSPVWYYLAALCGPGEHAAWVSAGLSTLSVGFFTLYLWKLSEADAATTAAGAGLMCVFGPLVAFTCQYGAEAFAVCLLSAALLVQVSSIRLFPAFCAGVFLGLAITARLQLVFNVFLFLSLFRPWARGVSFLCGLSLPLAAQWLRNAAVIGKYPWIFTWDGMATSSRDYNLLSTLIVQLHPSTAEATGLLHRLIIPVPEWLWTSGRYQFETILFLGVATACALLSGRLGVILATLSTLIYFLGLDDSLSAHFLRIWVGLFPVYCIAVGIVAGRLARRSPAWRDGTIAAVVGLGLLGVGYLKPDRIPPLASVTPPPELLTQDRYLVNSCFWHPESLSYRFPEKQFLGLPFHPEEFDAFQRSYPEFRHILWHGFNVQKRLYQYVAESGRFAIIGEMKTNSGYPYQVMEERAPPAPPRVPEP